MFDYSKLKCNFREKEAIREETEIFRNRYWKENTVPVDMEQIIMRLNIDIIPIHGLRHLERIDAYLKSDRTGVIVDYEQYMDDSDRYAARLRFSFAHEVGHFVLHKDIYDMFEINTPDEYSQFINDFPDYGSFEWQANEFAGSLLVPRYRLIEEIERCKSKLRKSNLYYLWETDKTQTLHRFSPDLRRVFGVSDDVIDRRISIERDSWF